MKRECPICGNIFDNRNSAKYCSDCRAAGKRICTQCGQVFVTPKPVSMCNACNNKRKRENEAKKKAREDKEWEEQWQQKNPQSLDGKVAAARAAGLSYGQYSAMRRGILRV